MEFRILGPLEVIEDGRDLALGAGRRRALLADLLLHHGEVLTTDRLIDDLWGVAPPENAVKAVHVHVSRLRRALAPGGGHDPIRTRGRGYVLDLAAHGLDALRFERLAQSALAARRDGAPQRTLELAAEGLALWRGPPLGDLGSEEFARAGAARLEELRLSTIQERIEAALELGRHVELVPELEALVAEHPYRERLRELSMLALYRSGRQADALEQFAAARLALTGELGIEPGEGLRELHAAVLRQDGGLAPPAPAQRPSAPAQGAMAPAPGSAAPRAPPAAEQPPVTPSRAGIAPRAAPAGAHAPMTVLFTDVEGSVALQTAHGDVEATGILGATETLARGLVEEHGGRVVKALGDGTMSSFDSPRRAVGCALEIQRRVAAGNVRNPALAVRVRAGVHTGELFAVEGDLHGAAVSAAARICASAAGGEVLVSDVVRQLCAGIDELAFTDRGLRALKGFDEPWALFGAASVTTAADDARGVASPMPFVGREAVRAELSVALQRAATGAGWLVMVGGEPGVGKSRLAEEVAAEARQRGFAVVTGHCHEAHGDVPYMPWIEVLEERTRDLEPEALLARLGEHAAALAQMAPELRRKAPGIPPLFEMPAEQQRRFLLNSVRAYVSGIARSVSQMLVLEDLHWADESTLSLVEHLADWIGEIPLIVLGTYRDTGLDLSAALRDALARLSGRRDVSLLSVQRHGEADVARMLASLTGEKAPRTLTAAIYAQSGGNALFVQEAGRWFAESGQVPGALAGHATSGGDAQSVLPAGLLLVIDQRLRRLRDGTRRLLGLAAVIGRSFELATLESIAAIEGDDLVEAIEEAERERLIAERAGGAGAGYQFVHDLFRQALLAGLSAPRRQRHHLAIADALERAAGSGSDPRAGAIARHLLAAGPAAEPERTARHLALAGARAQEAAAYEEALRHYDGALALTPAGNDEARAEVLVGLGLAQRSLGRWGDAVASWDQALAALERTGREDAIAELCWRLSQQLLWGYRFPEMAQVTRRGLDAIGERRSASRARLLAMNGLAVCLGGKVDEADRRLDEAMAIARDEPDPGLHGELGLALTVRRYFYMELPEAEQAGRAATAALREAASVWNLCDGLAFLDAAIVFQGRYDDAPGVHRELVPLARRLGHLGALSVAHRAEFASVAARRGRLDALAELAESAMETARRTANPGLVAHCESTSALVALWRGEWDRAVLLARDGARNGGPFWRLPQEGVLLLVLATIGERERALAHFDALAGELPAPARPNLIGAWTLASFAGEALGLLDEAGRAAAVYPLVVEALATGSVARQFDGRLLQASAGAAAGAAGLGDAAERHFELALEQSDRLPNALERPHARHLYARFLAARGGSGDRERARDLLAAAARGYAELGMPRHERLALATEAVDR